MTVKERVRTEPTYTFEQFTAIRRYQPTLTFSPDGSEIAYVVNTSGQFNLWRQSTNGGFAHQLTLSPTRLCAKSRGRRMGRRSPSRQIAMATSSVRSTPSPRTVAGSPR